MAYKSGKDMAYKSGKGMGYKSDKKMSYKSMDYKSGSGKKSMDSPKGMCSYPSNPMPMANQVYPMCGPGGNPDQQKANRLLQKAYKESDSLRGKSGM